MDYGCRIRGTFGGDQDLVQRIVGNVTYIMGWEPYLWVCFSMKDKWVDGGGIYFSMKDNCGLGFWSLNMEVGRAWMKHIETIMSPFGGGI